MLKKYIVPNTEITTILLNNILGVLVCSQPRKKDLSSSTKCPFNGLWCAEKQDRLDKWRDAVQYFAERHSNHVFYTRGDMFDGCPHRYATLCSKHNERQRD